MKGLERIVLVYLRPQMMDYWLPDGEATSCEIRQHSVWFDHVQCRSSTGAVLSPFLFILYSSDFQYNSRSLILQWLHELFVRQKVYRVLVSDFVKQSGKVSCFCMWERWERSSSEERRPTWPMSIVGQDVMWLGSASTWTSTSTTGWADQHRGCTQEVDE